MNTVELIDRLTKPEGSQGRIDAIRDLFLAYGFTAREKKAIESFLFEPTKERALKALECTPKDVSFYLVCSTD